MRDNDFNDAVEESIRQLREYKFKQGYKPLHPVLFDYCYSSKEDKEKFLEKYIHPDTYYAEKDKEWSFILSEPIWEVYHFPLLTKELSKMFIEEVENFNEWAEANTGPYEDETIIADDISLMSLPGTVNSVDKPLEYLWNDITNRYYEPIISYIS